MGQFDIGANSHLGKICKILPDLAIYLDAELFEDDTEVFRRYRLRRQAQKIRKELFLVEVDQAVCGSNVA